MVVDKEGKVIRESNRDEVRLVARYNSQYRRINAEIAAKLAQQLCARLNVRSCNMLKDILPADKISWLLRLPVEEIELNPMRPTYNHFKVKNGCIIDWELKYKYTEYAWETLMGLFP